MDRAAMMAEAYRRGLLGPKTAAYEDAAARGLVHDPYAAARVSARTAAGAPSGALMQFEQAIPGLSETTAGLGALTHTVYDAVTGQPGTLRSEWADQRGQQQGYADEFQAGHPILANTMRTAGTGAQIAAALATGGASEVPVVTNAVKTGLVAGTRRLAVRGAKNALTGATIAGANGVAQPGTIQERLDSGVRALAPGAVAGVATPVLGAGVAAGARAGGKFAAPIIRRVTNAFGGEAAAPEVAASAAPHAPAAPPTPAAPQPGPAPAPAPAPAAAPAAHPAPNAMTGTPAPAPRAPAAAEAPAGAAPAPPRSVTSLSPVEESALTKYARVAKLDPNAMTGKAAAYSEVGIEPTLIDTAGDRGQGVIRALSTKSSAGRDAVHNFATQRADNLPDRMSMQARNIVSSDPRTPEEIAQSVVDQRTIQANNDFTPIRNDPIQVNPNVATALQSRLGTQAVSRAADRAEADLDPARGMALRELADHLNNHGVIDPSSAHLTVGQMHDISRALFDKADAATDKGDQDALNALGARIRDAAKIQSPGYEQALENFANASRLGKAPAVGRQGLSANSTFPAALDDVASIPGGVDASGAPVDPQGLALARPGFRRAIEEASGNNTSAAPGVARRIANAPEQQARNVALLGEDDAGKLQNAMRLEGRAVENARNADPRAGSQTSLNIQDAASAAADEAPGMIAAGASALHGNIVPGVIQGMRLWLAARGFNNEEAEALSAMSVDPTRHQAALDYITSKAGPQAAQGFADQIQQTASQPAGIIPSAVAAANAFRPDPIPQGPTGP